MSGEEWRVVARHDGYEVSSLGRVRNRGTGRILHLTPHNKRYLKVRLGRRIHVYVHQLVAEAWHGPCPFGWQVDHDDFNRQNNTPGNLKYRTAPDNGTRWERYVRGEPEDHVPMTDAELAELEDHLDRASGW